MAKAKEIRVTQIKSRIGRSKKQCRTLEALGLRRINHSVTKQDTPQIRGMVEKVSHLVTVENL